MLILGENHLVHSSRDSVIKRIRREKPTILIHELIMDYRGDVTGLDLGEIRAIPQYNRQINNDVFLLAKELGIKELYGCGLSTEAVEQLKDAKLSTKTLTYEENMLEWAKWYSGVNGVIMVVNDTHLRKKASIGIGFRSLLVDAVEQGTLIAKIVRANLRDRELA